MRDTFLDARLVQKDLIRLTVFSSIPFSKIEGDLLIDHTQKIKLTSNRSVSLGNQLILDYKFEKPLSLGHSYIIVLNDYGAIPLDVSEATTFPSFDEEFAYEGDDLGCTYAKKETSFALWAPLASAVTLKIQKEGEEAKLLPMKRGEKGVYRISLEGDYEKAIYTYLVTNSEVTFEATDPYAKCSTPNSENSVVADLASLSIPMNENRLPVMNSICDAIIYEGHVRDLTIDPSTNIEHKGTFLGLIEKNRKTERGNPAGFDYLCSLGFTHLQLQPLQDYLTVDELHPEKRYNWGYDPVQYFAPEGSFASEVTDPYSRIRDCLKMVSAFHQEGIRIVVDVVYNHVYRYEHSPLEKIVPNYYFRRRRDGKMANTSGCGNDLASERKMVKKLLFDSAKWWIDYYSVDGFRFDLSGIVTVSLIQDIIAYGKKKNPYFVAYGEGWNMGGEVNEPLATMNNYYLLPDYAFFNDKFRESMKRYASGDLYATNEAKFSLVSSSLDFYGSKMFLDARQTINYVECHDNGTYFDYLSKTHPDFSLEKKLAICEFALALTLTSYGVPFIHSGQETAQSKWLNDNTYNAPDWYNRLSYKLIDERMPMVDLLKDLIRFRKKMRFLHYFDPRLIDQYLDIRNDEDLLLATISGEENTSPYRQIRFYYNPTDIQFKRVVGEEEISLFSLNGSSLLTKDDKKEAIIAPHGFLALALSSK